MLDDILKVFHLTSEKQKIHATEIAVSSFCIKQLIAEDSKICAKFNDTVFEDLPGCARHFSIVSLDIGVGSCRDSTEIQNYDNPKCPPVYTFTIPDIMKLVFLWGPYQL